VTETHHSVENFLTVNNKSTNFYSELVEAFQTCISFKINVAFVTFSGLQILLDTLKSAELRGIKGEVITSTYLNFTEPKSLRKLNSFANI
jgi:HKD family nuclease